MANPFASSKHLSLFPTMIPVVNITKDDYRLFYQHERALFEIFLVLLHREVVEATLVIGFLLWLERGGYASYPLSKIIINSLSVKDINQVANEVLKCIKFLHKKANNLMSQGSGNSYRISKLQSILDRKHINLDEFYHYGDLILHEVCCIANDVSVKALDDIVEQFIIDSAVGFQQGPSNQHTNFMQNYQMAYQYQHQQTLAFVPPVTDLRQSTCLGQNYAYAGSQMFPNCTQPVERVLDEEVPPDDRTVFLTFSKGYPLSKNEITEYFCRIFGDIIESIHMQPVEAGIQPLFATIVVRDPSSLKAVIEKDCLNGKSKYVIKGKHVWARKFVPRPP